MAKFDIAFKITVGEEGGYSNNKKDKGGETYKGISRNNFPDWEGWKILDQIPNKRNGQFFPQADNLVPPFYEINFWDKVKGDLIVSQKVANQMYDIAVNSGIKRAVSLTQSALCNMGYGISVDGVLGDITLRAINKVGDALNAPLVKERINFYNNIVQRDPSQKVFLNGWVARANRFA